MPGYDTSPDPNLFKREPRNPEYRWAYWGHRAQGFIVGCLLPAPVLALVLVADYWVYQVTEFWRYRSRRDAWYEEKAPTPDAISRDIADRMAGLYAALPVSIAWTAWLALRLLGIGG